MAKEWATGMVEQRQNGELTPLNEDINRRTNIDKPSDVKWRYYLKERKTGKNETL
jgi:3-methyladenine DNA glycosylase Mpg